MTSLHNTNIAFDFYIVACYCILSNLCMVKRTMIRMRIRHLVQNCWREIKPLVGICKQQNQRVLAQHLPMKLNSTTRNMFRHKPVRIKILISERYKLDGEINKFRKLISTSKMKSSHRNLNPHSWLIGA